MNAATCPSCKANLPPQEVIDGWCETCGKKLPTFVRNAATASDRKNSVVAKDASRARDHGVRDGWCDVCQQTRPGVARCYLKVIGQRIGVANVTQRWVNVGCTCCAACYRLGRSLQTLRYAALAAIFGVPALLFAVCGLLLDRLEQQYGVPRGVTGGLALTALGLSVMIWFVSPLWIRFATRRRLRRLLNPAMDERLKALAGVRGWGWRNYVTTIRQVPRNERFVELRQV